MYICIYVYIYACLIICFYVYMYVVWFIRICIFLCMYECVYAFTYVYVRRHTSVGIGICKICVCASIFVRTSVCLAYSKPVVCAGVIMS